MTLPLPVAHVSYGTIPVAQFFGEEAIERATLFISTLSDHESGVYSIDVSDDQCPSCEQTMSREAWQQVGHEWVCPNCGAPDGRSRPTSLLPEN